MAVCTSHCVNYGTSFFTSSLQLSFGVRSCFQIVRVLHFFSEFFFSIKLAVNSPKTLAIPFLDVIVSTLSIFHFRDERFASRFYAGESAVPCLVFCSFSVPDALFVPLAHFSQLVSVSFRNVSSFFNESSDFNISIIFFYFCCFATSAYFLFSCPSLLLLLRLRLHPECVLLRLFRPHPDCVLLQRLRVQHSALRTCLLHQISFFHRLDS